MQRRTLAILAGLLAVIFWGASFIAIKIALKQSQPITLIVIRLGIGLCVLVPIAWMRGELGGLSLKDHALMILLGVIGVTGHQWLQAEGMLSAGATTASWLAALAPAFMVILAGFFLQERIAPHQVAGLVLALLGADSSFWGSPGLSARGELRLLGLSRQTAQKVFYGDHGQKPNHQTTASASAVTRIKIKLLIAEANRHPNFERGVS